MADVDAQVGLLGALLHDLPARPRIRAMVAPDDFEGFGHQALFLASLQTTSVEELTLWLEDHYLLATVGGVEAIEEIHDQSPGAANVECFARMVHDAAAA